MSEISDELYQRLHGFRAIKREEIKENQSKWYYLDLRYNEGDKRREIDVETENIINPLLKEVLAYDVNKNPEEYYIWRTVGDDKVRSSHEEHDGYAFNWHIAPNTGHPGNEANCRCSAISYNPKKHKILHVDLRGLKIGDDEDKLIIIITQADITGAFAKSLEGKETINYSLYGDSFTKEFIDQMLADERFQQALKLTLSNEGGYSNNPLDKGGKTNYGISAKIYPNEDIENLTRERASAIYYRDYWIKPKTYMLPDKFAYIVFDDGVLQGQSTAIKNLQKALGIKADGIIGFKTTKAAIHADNSVKRKFIQNIHNVEDEYLKNNPSQKIFEKGHRNRFKKY